jgi:hypothetical protein
VKSNVWGVKITAVKKEVVALSNDLGHIATLLVAGSDQYNTVQQRRALSVVFTYLALDDLC